MKPCHENNGAAIYVGRTATVHNPLFECSHYSRISEQELFYWSVAPANFKIYCGLCTFKAKNANKNIQQRSLSGFITIDFNY